MLNNKTIAHTAKAVASLLPYIVQGVHSSVLTKGALTQTQFRIVVTMSLKGPCTMSDIASQMKVSLPTMSGIVNRLVASKYLKRKSHANDRRQVMIELTPKAHAFLKEFEGAYANRWEQLLLLLDDKQVLQMLDIANTLSDGLQKKTKT